MERSKGVVKFFNEQKGWGFLQRDDGEDIFVHHSDIQEDPKVLKELERVSFVIEESKTKPGKYKATDVIRLKD